MTRFISLRLLAFATVIAGAACDRHAVNPPTEPADPIATPEASAAPPVPPPGVGGLMQGAGPATFVGRWAVRADGCATTGEGRPIALSTTRFEGYENSCAIVSLGQTPDGYEAALACDAEGTTARERVRLSVQGDALRLTWLDRDDAVVQLVRCPDASRATTPAGGPS